MHGRKHMNGVIWNSLGSTMYGANSFIMLAMVSRIGTVEQAGCFGIAFTTAQILYIVGLFGVSHFQMTDYKERYHFQDYWVARCISGMLMLVICFAAILCLRFSQEKIWYTILLTILMLLNAFGDLYQNLFFQKNRLDLSGSTLFFRTLVSLLFFCAILLITRNIAFAIISQIISNGILTLFYAKKIAKPFLPVQSGSRKASVRSLVTECLPLFFSLFFMNIIINASKYGVEFFLDDTAQGYYNMIFMPVQVINLCSQFIFKPYLNQYAAALSSTNHRTFWKLFVFHCFLIAGFIFAGSLASYYFGTLVLGFIYGKDISSYALTLTLVVLGGGIYAVCQLCYYIFVLLRCQTRIMVIYIVGLIVAAVSSAYFISAFGLLGAALSFIAVQIVILILYSISFVQVLNSTKRNDAYA